MATERGGIPLSWLVSVTSTGVKNVFSLSKLHTLAITKYNENLPTIKWNKVYNADSVSSLFGYSSVEYTFGYNYFSFTNKNSSKADLLTFYTWTENPTPACLVGAKLGDLSALQSVNGNFKILMGDKTGEYWTRAVTLDLSTCQSYTDIASKVQEAIRVNTETSFANASVIYSTLTNGLIVKCGVSGANSYIGFTLAPTEGNDISQSIGLSEVEGATIIDGSDAETFDEVLSTLDSVNGNYYVIDTTFTMTDTEALTLAKFTHNSSDRFLGIYNSSDTSIITTEGALDSYSGYDGFLVNYFADSSPIGFVSGIISSIKFNATNGNLNIAFNDATNYESIAIDTKAKINVLEANNANSILKFGNMGQTQVWYGMGNIQGTKTNSANVYITNSYLMFQLQYAFANLLNSQGFIGLRGSFNNGIIINTATEIFSDMVDSGIVVTDAELTDTETQKVISVFGDEAESAIKQIESNGYYIQIGDIDLENNTLSLSTAYVANKNLKRLIINNYILGA